MTLKQLLVAAVCSYCVWCIDSDRAGGGDDDDDDDDDDHGDDDNDEAGTCPQEAWDRRMCKYTTQKWKDMQWDPKWTNTCVETWYKCKQVLQDLPQRQP